MSHNPLLQPWDTPHGLPPFERFEVGHFEPALRHAMALQRTELAAIAGQAAAPDFKNTVAALDRSGAALSRVASVFYNLAASAANPALQAVQRDMAAPLSAHNSALFQDAALFARVDQLHEQRHALKLLPEQLRLLERTQLDFVRAGACLVSPQRERYALVMETLAQLTTRFAQNVLQEESAWVLALPDAAALAGLPQDLQQAAAQAAADRGLTGHVVTLSRSLVVPFLTHSTRADLREAAWRAWTSRGEGAGATDNRELARDILRLRREQATLLGHTCFADHALADTMAGQQAAVQGLLLEVWPRALAAVARERAELLQAQAAAGVQQATLEPWDWRYWAEQVKRQRYAVDDAEVKPYFTLENVVQAAFDCAQRLFGVHFERRADLPVYHPDVVAYEMRNSSGAVAGIFLQDNFARPNKRSGAWMSSLRSQTRNAPPDGLFDLHPDAAASAQIPVVVNNNNFARGAPGAPTLLSLDDARTLFHEFGHGLHGLLSNVTYERLSGTHVLRDFVELPSQLFEHWIMEPEVLQRHARHWQTGQPIPADLVQRLQRAPIWTGLRDGALHRQRAGGHDGACFDRRGTSGRFVRL